MFSAKRHYTTIIFLALFLMVSACSSVSERMNQGNSNGNLNNSGIMVEAKDWLYFLNIKDEQKLYRFKNDGTSVEKFSDAKALFLNYIDPYLYYVSGDDQQIHQVNLNDKSDLVFSEHKVSRLLVTNDLMYYIKDDKLFSMDLKAKNEKQLSDQRVMSFNVENKDIYIVNDQQELFKLGETKTKISDKSIRVFNVLGNSIYYIDESDQHLYRMNSSGEESKVLTEKPVTMLNVSEDWIYYSDSDNGVSNLMKMKLDGSSSEVINQSTAILLCVSENWMHYLDFSMEGFQFKSVVMKTDGSNMTEYVAAPTATPPVEIQKANMQEQISMENYVVTVDSVYKTNLLKNTEVDDSSVIFDDVTDNMYLFVNLTFENLSDKKLEVQKLMGLMNDIDNQNMRSMYFPLIKEMKEEGYRRKDFEDQFIVESQTSKKLQLFFEIGREEPQLYLALIPNENEEPTIAIELDGDSYFVVGFEEANQTMLKIFDKDKVVQKGGFGYTFQNETEEKMYYGFEVIKAKTNESVFYAVERDSGVVYEAVMDSQYPDHPIPTKQYQP